jgi:hypothetical protein
VSEARPSSETPNLRQGDRLRTAAAKLKPPKALLITIGITLLTAWLFPALSHQWQDRQKARELSAGLVSQIGENTSKALITSDFVTFGRLLSTSNPTKRGFNRDAFNQLDLEWRTQSTQIEAKLRAYYSASVVEAWRDYRSLVHGTYFLITDNMNMRDNTLVRLKHRFAGRIDPSVVEAMRKPWITTHDPAAKRAYLVVSTALAEEQSLLIEAILDDHSRGFSTRTSDVLRDIVPFY